MNDLIERLAAEAKVEIRRLALRAQVEIAHRFAFINRSLGQRRRYARAAQLRSQQ